MTFINYFKKTKSKFIFVDLISHISVYILINNQITQIIDRSEEKLKSILNQLKKSHPDIMKGNSYWLLGGNNYQIINIEKTPMTISEMYENAKWPIQEIIGLPAQDFYYKLIPNNIQEDNFFKKTVTSVVVKKSIIDYITATFKDEKISLNYIDTLQTSLNHVFRQSSIKHKKKPIAVLKLDTNIAQMFVYLEGGLLMSRQIDLSKTIETTGIYTEEYFSNVLSKLIVEIQRNTDFLDRQQSILPFEEIIFIAPNRVDFLDLEKKICEYFSITQFNISELDIKFQGLNTIPFEILGALLTLKEGYQEDIENINLISRLQNSSFKDDFLKLSLYLSLSGLTIAGVNSFYEINNTQINQEINIYKKSNEELKKDIEKIKNIPLVIDTNLQKEISTLINTKDILSQMQSNNIEQKNYLYFNFLYDLSQSAYLSKVYLDKIEYNNVNNNLYLHGYSNDKIATSIFIKNLQGLITLKDIKLNNFLIQNNIDNNNYEFSISSHDLQSNIKEAK